MASSLPLRSVKPGCVVVGVGTHGERGKGDAAATILPGSCQKQEPYPTNHNQPQNNENTRQPIAGRRS